VDNLVAIYTVIISIFFKMTVAACKQQFSIRFIFSRVQHVVAGQMEQLINTYSHSYHLSVLNTPYHSEQYLKLAMLKNKA
jgi:hypothetical protein